MTPVDRLPLSQLLDARMECPPASALIDVLYKKILSHKGQIYPMLRAVDKFQLLEYFYHLCGDRMPEDIDIRDFRIMDDVRTGAQFLVIQESCYPCIGIKGNSERWYDENGLFHRLDGPANIITRPCVCPTTRFSKRAMEVPVYEGWFFHGKAHRIDGPSSIWRYPSGELRAMVYRVYNRFQRADGPVVVAYRRRGIRDYEYLLTKDGQLQGVMYDEKDLPIGLSR